MLARRGFRIAPARRATNALFAHGRLTRYWLAISRRARARTIMLEHLEKLRFLRRAAEEGLISREEYEQHRGRLLRAAIDILRPNQPVSNDGVAAARPAAPVDPMTADVIFVQQRWASHTLVAALIEVLEWNVANARARTARSDVAAEQAAPVAAHRQVGREGPTPTTRPVRHADHGTGSEGEPSQNRARAFHHRPSGRKAGPSGVHALSPLPRRAANATPFSFAFDRSGRHRNTNEKLPSVDPLSIHMQELWKEAERLAGRRDQLPMPGVERKDGAAAPNLVQRLASAVQRPGHPLAADACRARLRRNSPAVAPAVHKREHGHGHAAERGRRLEHRHGCKPSRPYVNRICISVHANLVV